MIELFRRLANLLSYEATPDDSRMARYKEITGLLKRWEDGENIAKFRDVLGLSMARGRRRTQRTVNLEYAIAFAYAGHKRRRTRNARNAVAEEFGVDPRTVDRAAENWGPPITKTLKVITASNPDAQVDYTLLLKRLTDK